MTQPEGFTHLDDARRRAHGRRQRQGRSTSRTASASGRVLVSAEVVALLRGGGVPKGDAIAVARIAGIQAAKRTPDLVPLCHPIAIHGVDVDLVVDDDGGRDRGDRAHGGPYRRRDGGAHLRRRRRRSRSSTWSRRSTRPRSSRGVRVEEQDRRQDRPTGTGPMTSRRALAVTVSTSVAGSARVDRTRAPARRRAGALGFDVDGPDGRRGRRPGRDGPAVSGRGGYDVVVTTGGTGLTPDRPHARDDPARRRPRGAGHRRGDPGVRRRPRGPDRGPRPAAWPGSPRHARRQPRRVHRARCATGSPCSGRSSRTCWTRRAVRRPRDAALEPDEGSA